MLRYVIKRFAFMLVTFVIIIFTVFVIVKSLPDQFIPPIGESTEFYDRLREKEGWDKPPVEQFFIWASNVIQDGDFGWSLKQNRSVTGIMFEKNSNYSKIEHCSTSFICSNRYRFGYFCRTQKE